MPEAGKVNRIKSGEETGGKRGLFFCCILFFGVMLSFLLFYHRSGNWERLLEAKNRAALAEMLLVSALLFLIGKLSGRSRRRLFSGAGLLVLAELWLHQMLLPFAASLVYAGVLLLAFLLLFGELKGFAAWNPESADTPEALHRMEKADRRRRLSAYFAAPQNGEEKYLLLSLPFLLIQLNRMNIAVDYDSLRYGLRSQYVLFNGSFFSALGQVNAVYSYPKGLEILTAGLSSFRSFALLLMFQFWCLILILVLIGKMTARLSGSRRRGFQAMLCLAMMSSLGNMSVTAKTDLITLLCQLYMLSLYLRGKRLKSLAAAILTLAFKPTAVVFTTVSFGTLLMGELLLKGAEMRRRRQPAVLEGSFRGTAGHGKTAPETGTEAGSSRSRAGVLRQCLDAGLPALLAALLFTGFVTLRTLIVTGVPFSTTFTSLFQALGFTVRWPFNFDAHIDYGSSVSLGTALLQFGRRLLLFLFCPVGEDMAHVEIAWGGVEIPLLLAAAFGSCRRLFAKKRAFRAENNVDKSRKLVALLFLSLSLISTLTFYMLWQVDGNYYILWDSVLLLTAFLPTEPNSRGQEREPLPTEPNPWETCEQLPAEVESTARAEEKPGAAGQLRRTFVRLPRLMMAVSLYAAALLTTLITSWAGAVGFTPVRLLNRGYYDNIEEIRAFETARGAAELWAQMSADPANRVLAFASTPDCYKILCNVQSITDVEGSGGSPGLYDSLTYFEWFLRWAETDYIYIEAEFLQGESEARARDMLDALCADGVLYDFQETGGKLLCRVDQARLVYAWNGEPAPAPDESRVAEGQRILKEIRIKYE